MQAAWGPWTLPVALDLALLLGAFLYMRGWIYLRLAGVDIIPAWRACSFLFGLFLMWLAVGSPLAAFDEQLLTVHMLQHLLLMTCAPALILLGAPVMPLLHGLPGPFLQTLVAPLLRLPQVQRAGHLISRSVFCWLAAAAALVGWHIPSAFTLALQSETWHVVEHASFLAAGFLFWWPVIQPWPRAPHRPRWSILLYLFLATLPCDILSAYLTFCDRIVYPVYLNTPRPFGISPLEDQQCAGALMWTCITFVYLLPAAMLTIKLLEARTSTEDERLPSELPGVAASQSEPRSIEAV